MEKKDKMGEVGPRTSKERSGYIYISSNRTSTFFPICSYIFSYLSIKGTGIWKRLWNGLKKLAYIIYIYIYISVCIYSSQRPYMLDFFFTVFSSSSPSKGIRLPSNKGRERGKNYICLIGGREVKEREKKKWSERNGGETENTAKWCGENSSGVPPHKNTSRRQRQNI